DTHNGFRHKHARADGGGGFDHHQAGWIDDLGSAGNGQAVIYSQSDSRPGSGEQRFSPRTRGGRQGEPNRGPAVPPRTPAGRKKAEGDGARGQGAWASRFRDGCLSRSVEANESRDVTVPCRTLTPVRSQVATAETAVNRG